MKRKNKTLTPDERFARNQETVAEAATHAQDAINKLEAARDGQFALADDLRGEVSRLYARADSLANLADSADNAAFHADDTAIAVEHALPTV